ncbi:MAG: glycosyltransferase family 39 protein [Anaerolineae bacterium]|jgi:4-amino-4-deoxy-L-arabinose transferase-like glycosyltransferase
MAISNRRESGWPGRLLPWLLIGGLVLFHAANNWIWLSENVTSTGWDKPRHLARSLNYSQMLSPVTIRSLFGVMISDPVRPPLFPTSATIPYKLFGYTADVATMVNVLYMAIALAATYGIGRRWGGRRQGMAGAALLALFPMFYSMSRYFYLEFALTAMVALTVYLMLASDGFERRGVSLLFGLSLGLGLLTKRTFVVFAAGPVVVGVLGAGLLPALWRRVKQRPRIYWRQALVALGAGLALAALWYWPNREAVGDLVLGDLLFFLWWALAALAIYFSLLPSAPLANALAAFFLGAGLASTWYLARIEFLQRVALYGYGIDDPRGRSLRLDSLDTYLYYVRKLGNEHLSMVIFAALVAIVLVAAVVYVRRQGSMGRALRRVRMEGWAVLAWLAGGYGVLTLSIYQETRAFTPALPAVALVLAAALFKLPWRRVRWALVAALLVFGLVQFAAVSYEPIYDLLTPVTFRLPVWGRTTTLAQGVYIQLPDEDDTDRGYWIVPDVLARMEAQRRALGEETLSLGLLANTTQINAGPFNYLILTEYPHLRVESLVDRFDERSPYRRLFGHGYALVKRVNSGTNPSQTAVMEAIVEGPPHLFAGAFELETTYALPDGDVVYLYRRRYNLPADYAEEYVTGLAEGLAGRTRAGDGLLLTPPELVGPLTASYGGPAEIYLAPAGAEELAAMAAAHDRLFVVVGDGQAGQAETWVMDWLNENAFRASHEWSDSLQLVIYGTGRGPLAESPSVEVEARLGEEGFETAVVELAGYDLPAGPWEPGDVVPLTVFWQARQAVGAEYQVFVHLLDGEGRLVAQNDGPPAGGARPTSGWAAGETVTDRRGLLLPAGLAAGAYQVRIGLYRPDSGERLMAWDGQGAALGDGVPLGSLTVESP